MRQNLTGQGHRRRHVQQPLILRFRYPVLIFGPFPRGLKMSAALEAGFLCSRPRSTQLHFGRTGEVAQNAPRPALITNDLLASFRKVGGFCQWPTWVCNILQLLITSPLLIMR